MKLEIAVSRLEALGNSTRLDIYRALVRAGDQGLPVGQIQDTLGIPASTLSHHCKRLIETGLITRQRKATTLICRADYTAMRSLLGYLYAECCAGGSCGACVDANGKSAIPGLTRPVAGQRKDRDMGLQKSPNANPAAVGGSAASCCTTPPDDDRTRPSGCCGGPPPEGSDACCRDDADAKAAGGCGCGSSGPMTGQ